jgi:DNA-directed RNA polymerase subunit M/transcription elongation factor TFIIS
MPDPCPACQGLVVKARGNTTRCTSCGKAWSADGAELSEEEAKALVPKPRAKRAGGKKTAARSGRGGTRTATRARAKAAAANGDDPGSDT